MASDNILAALAGVSEGLQNTLVPWMQKNQEEDRQMRLLKRKQQMESLPVGRIESLSGFETGLPKNEILSPLEIGVVQKRIEASKPTTFIDASGNVTYRGAGTVKQTKTQEDFDTRLARIEAEAGARAKGSSKSESETKKLALQMQDDFYKASGDFPKMRDAYNRVKTSAKDPSAAGDLALVFNYMKLLDPTSVVREGEFATAQNSGSVSSIITARYNKILSGERLDEKIRKDFVDRSERLYTSSLQQQKKNEGQFRKRAKAYNIPEDFVISDLSLPEEASPAPAGNSPEVPQEVLNQLPKGVKVKSIRRID